jgi:hypothetical protein
MLIWRGGGAGLALPTPFPPNKEIHQNMYAILFLLLLYLGQGEKYASKFLTGLEMC